MISSLDVTAIFAVNLELIARLEKKIQATLARVWGNAAPTKPKVHELKEAVELTNYRLPHSRGTVSDLLNFLCDRPESQDQRGVQAMHCH